eukprot:8993281-Lingulodinium_polyedra.AAC.1
MERAACDSRAAAAADGRFERIIEHMFVTVHNDAVESTVCRYNGSRIARLTHSMRTPVLVFAWSAR